VVAAWRITIGVFNPLLFLSGVAMRKAKRKGKGGSAQERSWELSQMARRVRYAIKAVMIGLGALFALFQIKGIDFQSVLNGLLDNNAATATELLLLKTAMVLYYSCWIAGALWDTEVQENVYRIAPNRGIMPPQGWALFGIVGASAAVLAVLCWAGSPHYFAAALAGFLLINYITWRVLVDRVIKESIRDGIATYSSAQQFAKLESLKLWAVYIDGAWQNYRFGVGGAIVTILCVIAFSPLIGAVSRMTGVSSENLLVILGIFIYLATLEGWIWIMRVKTKIGIETIRMLNDDYNLTKRRDY
jgi:hypothetical protein